MFKDLVILNCKLDGHYEWSTVLNGLEKKIFCFRPVTCARQIFIFHNLSTEERSFLNTFVEEISSKSKSCEVYIGFEAYEFLLKWVVGLMNSKYQNNDRFVLGTFRQMWTSFCKENAEQLKGHDFLKLIPLLLGDASTIRRIIEQELTYLNVEIRFKESISLCSKYRHAREQDQNLVPIKSVYSFFDPENGQLSKSKKSSIDLGKKINRIQEQLCQIENSRVIDPKPEEGNKKGKKLIFLIQLGITSCWEKRQLEKEQTSAEIKIGKTLVN